MTLFMTNKQAAEKISGLEARVGELESDITAAKATITTLQAESVTKAENIVSLTAERDKATADLAAAQATLADQEATVTAANEKLATFDTEVAAKVLLQVSSIGFKGEIPGASADEPGASTKTREQFNAMNHIERNAFLKAGGKLKG